MSLFDDLSKALRNMAAASWRDTHSERACDNTVCVCGHTRCDHCGCGKECLWHGPLKRMDDGKMEYDGGCDCAGFSAATQIDGDGFCDGRAMFGLGPRGK
jgi:hypothetical protein